jgi:DNA-binding GntR family transcriptional regulator
MRAVENQGPQLWQLEQTSLRVQVRRVIRTGIITGEIEEGTIYPISYFASRFGVSATPVREALLDLANAGLIESIPNRGFRIPVLSDHDLDEIFEVRLMLEVPSMGRVAHVRNEDDLKEYQVLANEIKKYAQQSKVAEFLLADRAFHQRLLQTLHNQRLVKFVARLRDQARLIGLPHLAKSGLLMVAVKEHAELLDAIKQKDAASTESVMRRHLEHTRGIWAGRSEDGDNI